MLVDFGSFRNLTALATEKRKYRNWDAYTDPINQCMILEEEESTKTYNLFGGYRLRINTKCDGIYEGHRWCKFQLKINHHQVF